MQRDPRDASLAGQVRSRLKTGGGALSYQAPDSDNRGIAVDSTTVYWVATGVPGQHNGALRSCPIAGCTQSTLLLSGLDVAEFVVVDDRAIYVSEYGLLVTDPGGPVPGRITRLAKR